MITKLSDQQLMELVNEETFQDELKNAKGTTAVQKTLYKNGITMSKDEVSLILEYAAKKQETVATSAGKLNDEDLDHVVGGFDFENFFDGAKKVATGVFDTVADGACAVGRTLSSESAIKIYKTISKYIL